MITTHGFNRLQQVIFYIVTRVQSGVAVNSLQKSCSSSVLEENIEICYLVCCLVVLVIGYERVMNIHDLNSVVFMNAP